MKPAARTALERWTVRAVRPGLARTRRLLALLQHPDRAFPFVHITGTNGKGSVAAMLASILSAAGCRTGRFTSPHLRHERERLVINGRVVSPRVFSAAVEALRPALIRLHRNGNTATTFEAWTVLAAEAFRRARVDVAVVEVGMGGRLDATTTFSRPCLTVLTHVALDHTRELGSTREAILKEKLGIVRPGVPLISAEPNLRLRRRIRAHAHRVGASVAFAGCQRGDEVRILNVRPLPDGLRLQLAVHGRVWPWMKLPLAGEFQASNAALAVLGAQILARQGYPITGAVLRRGLAQTRWPGRMEVIHRRPRIILDGAHNPEALRAVMQTMAMTRGRVWLIMGVMADKDVAGMCREAASKAAGVWTVTPPDPRALPAAELARQLQKHGLDAKSEKTYGKAIKNALNIAKKTDTIVVLGSLYNIEKARKSAIKIIKTR